MTSDKNNQSPDTKAISKPHTYTKTHVCVHACVVCVCVCVVCVWKINTVEVGPTEFQAEMEIILL